MHFGSKRLLGQQSVSGRVGCSFDREGEGVIFQDWA